MHDGNGSLTLNTRLTMSVVLIIAAIVASAAAMQIRSATNEVAIVRLQAEIRALPDDYVPRREIQLMAADIKDIKVDVKELLHDGKER